MKHWKLEDVAWSAFDPARLDPSLVSLVKAAAMVERNGPDYGTYLNRVFHDDPDFSAAADNWSVEEVQHGDALGRWAMLADPAWNYEAAFARYKAGYHLPLLDAQHSVRGSRTGELIARCIVESGTSSYYSALADATEEPVLRQVCKLIAADEYRHFKLFYDHLKRYLRRENIGFLGRLRIALGRVGESEDDELAYAFYCSNAEPDAPYQHDRCIAGYMSRAMAAYRYDHLERGIRMILKAIGINPRGRARPGGRGTRLALHAAPPPALHGAMGRKPGLNPHSQRREAGSAATGASDTRPYAFPKPANPANPGRLWPRSDAPESTPRKTCMSDTIAGLSFEDALAELERIVRGLEGGQQKLEDAITCYERGTALRRHCESKLAEAEARVQAIVERADGALSLKPVE